MLIKISDLNTLIKKISQSGKNNFKEVIAPISADGDSSGLSYRKISLTDNFILDGYRSIDPLKILLYNMREKVYPANEKEKNIVA